VGTRTRPADPALNRSRDLDGVPERIAAVRMGLGLSQGRFAARVSVTRNMVTRWERGHNRPRVPTLERIASTGGVRVDWLLRGGGHGPQLRREPTLAAAVARLRAAGRDPSRRARLLRALDDGS
jgi:transcriptional regulator with XRE-family HTH domain